MGGGSKGEPVTITSIAAKTRWGRNAIWVTSPWGSRQKVSASHVYPVDDHNSPLIAEINAIWNQIDSLRSKIDNAQDRLVAYQIPPEE